MFRKNAKRRLHLAKLRAIKQNKRQDDVDYINANKLAVNSFAETTIQDDAQDHLDDLCALAEKYEAEALTVDELDEADDIPVEALSKPLSDLHAQQNGSIDLEENSNSLQALNARFYHLYVYARMKAEYTKLARRRCLNNQTVEVRVSTYATYQAAKAQFVEEHPLADVPTKTTVLGWFRNMSRYNALEPVERSKGFRSPSSVERVILLLRDQPSLSSRQVSKELGIGKTTVNKIVKDLKLKGLIAI